MITLFHSEIKRAHSSRGWWKWLHCDLQHQKNGTDGHCWWYAICYKWTIKQKIIFFSLYDYMYKCVLIQLKTLFYIQICYFCPQTQLCCTFNLWNFNYIWFKKLHCTSWLFTIVGYASLICTLTILAFDHTDWQAHNNAIFDMAWVEGEGRILTASGDQTVVLWDVERQEKLDVFRGHTSSVRCVCAQQGSNGIFINYTATECLKYCW